MLNHLSLFTGIGGFDLAAEWAGFTTVAMCEPLPYNQAVLHKHWLTTPIFNYIQDITEESCVANAIPSVDLITGGFPCQPFSHAGQEKGIDDERYLWPEYLRIIKQERPRWVVAENVRGLIKHALDDVLWDLDSAGYATRTYLLPVSAAGAPHERKRVYIVAHTNSPRLSRRILTGNSTDQKHLGPNSEPITGTRIPQPCVGRATHRFPGWLDGTYWPADKTRPQKEWEEPRLAHSIPRRKDRIIGLGNSVSPIIVYPILKWIHKQLQEEYIHD